MVSHKTHICMLRQIQQTQDTMRKSVQLHMERKYFVLVNSENIVVPQGPFSVKCVNFVLK